MGTRRFDAFFERHIGIGLRWDLHAGYPLTLSLALPFVTVTVGIGACDNATASAAPTAKGVQP